MIFVRCHYVRYIAIHCLNSTLFMCLSLLPLQFFFSQHQITQLDVLNYRQAIGSTIGGSFKCGSATGIVYSD